MPPPYPVLLFTGQRIIDEAHQITGKVVERISHATLASLTAKPVDDIVQALYDEHYIHLPILDRNGAEHEEFEFFYAPYRHRRLGRIAEVRRPRLCKEKHFNSEIISQ